MRVDYETNAHNLDTFMGQVPEQVILFGASWCVPCRQFKPHFIKAAESFDFPFTIAYVDDFEDMDEGTAVSHYGLMTVPTVRYHRNKFDTVDLKERRILAFINEINETRNA